MKICGWLRNASYSALVPLLGCPTMKKSGTRGSVEAVIAPERRKVAVEMLAERHHLALEAAPDLPHQLLVGRRHVAEDQLPLRGLQRLGTHAPGHQHLG